MSEQRRWKYYRITDTEPELLHCAACQSDNLKQLPSAKFICLTCGEGGQDFGGVIAMRTRSEYRKG